MSGKPVKLSPPQCVLVALSSPGAARIACNVMRDEHGILAATVVTDGQAAWSVLQEGKVDFAVLQWKLKDMSAIVLFNRIRQDERMKQIPILFVSNLVQKEAFAILADYPPTAHVDESFTIKSFSIKCELLLNEACWYKVNTATLDAMASHMKADPAKAKAILAELVKGSPQPAVVLLLAARVLTKRGLLAEAEALLAEALALDKKNSGAVLALAQVQVLGGRTSEALSLLTNHKFSIKTIERHLLVGEINLLEKNAEEARRVFSTVLEIDEANEKAKSGLLVADNLISYLAGTSEEEEEATSKSFASVLNLVAVSLVKEGKPEEGIEHYKAALSFVHDPLVRARVMYNLGLAYVREKKNSEAIVWFQKAVDCGGDRIPNALLQVKKLSGE